MTGRVIVAISTDSASDAALHWAIRWASARSMELVVCTVHSAHRYEDDFIDRSHRAVIDSARDVVERLAPELAARFVLERGELVETISSLSASAHLVVVGARRGLAPFEATGTSLSLKLAGTIATPLVVVPEGWRDSPTGSTVVGVDGTSDAEAIEFAAASAASASNEIVLVHVISPPLRRSSERVDDRNEPGRAAFTAAEYGLQQQCASLRWTHPDVTVSGQVAVGDPARALVHAAVGQALIVVGTSHRIAFSSLFAGSPGRDLIVHASCPVAIVPQHVGRPISPAVRHRAGPTIPAARRAEPVIRER